MTILLTGCLTNPTKSNFCSVYKKVDLSGSPTEVVSMVRGGGKGRLAVVNNEKNETFYEDNCGE